MNISLLVSSLNSGGAERVAVTLCNAWAESGLNVNLIATYRSASESFFPISERVNMTFLGGVIGGRRGVFGYFEKLRAIRQILSSQKPDVAISFLPNVNVAALLATVRRSFPLVISERSDPFMDPRVASLNLACRMGYRFADALVVQTDAVKEKIGSLYSVPPVVAVVPNPLPDNIVQSEHRGGTNSTRTLVSVGRLSPEKQVDHMIRVFTKVAAWHPTWRYHIYGDGPQRENLQNLIAALGMGERVKLMGRTSAPWEVMADADAFMMASRYEGFPNALLEAMGVGLPCVVLDCPSGPSEITRGGQDASLVSDPDSLPRALDQVLGDSSLRDHLGKQARSSILQRYRTESVLSEWGTVFRKVGLSL